MFWIIFSNCVRAIKLPLPNLTLKMRESASKEATGKDSKYFLQMTSALTVQKLFVPRFASAKQQNTSGNLSKPHLCSLHLYKPLHECQSCHRMIDPSITLLLNAISGQWRSMSLLILAFVNLKNLIKWMYWREKKMPVWKTLLTLQINRFCRWFAIVMFFFIKISAMLFRFRQRTPSVCPCSPTNLIDFYAQNCYSSEITHFTGYTWKLTP